jgi:hypothetical protein
MNKSFLPIHKIILATVIGISFASTLFAEPLLAHDKRGNTDTGSIGSSLDDSNGILLEKKCEKSYGSLKEAVEDANKEPLINPIVPPPEINGSNNSPDYSSPEYRNKTAGNYFTPCSGSSEELKEQLENSISNFKAEQQKRLELQKK